MRKRAKFNLSNFHNCTFKMGYLYPVNLLEVLPGDSIQMSPSVFLRFAPMVAPVMHPTYMFVHHFYVPSRVIGSAVGFDFEAFITGGATGEDVSTIPTVTLGANSGILPDAFGLPTFNLAAGKTFSVNALPFLAYYMIWNEYYRDQDLGIAYGLPDILNLTEFNLAHVAWNKDYFTTARPWPQKGPEVTLPVTGLASGEVAITAFDRPIFRYTNGVDYSDPFLVNSGRSSSNPVPYPELRGDDSCLAQILPTGGVATVAWDNPGLKGVLNNAEISGLNIDINGLREAMALQRFEEHRSLFGSRYEDYLRYLGVRPQDARLQMPEYLGGFSSPVQFSEVLQTAGDDAGGVGQMFGHGIAAAKGRRVRRFIPEHGYIMSLLCVRPIPVYAQGIERLWSKSTKYDFWTKELEHIGQQEVLNSEVYADGNTADGNTFGYQNRYDEYRRGVSVITGEFRGNQDYWTLARLFASRPALNSNFVECEPSDRIFQVSAANSDQVYAMVKNNVIAKRLVSKNGNPI